MKITTKNLLNRSTVFLCLLAACTTVPDNVGKLSYNTVKPDMVLINGGTFEMGQAIIATPVNQVTVSPFLIDNTDVTQGDYQSIMNVNPSYFGNDSLLPVVSETWYDAVLYCNARSRAAGLDTVYSFTSISGTPGNGCDSLGSLMIDYTKNGFRLPTEAEWEFACRSGSRTRYYWGDEFDLDFCWDTTNSGGRPHRVGQKVPNGSGLYDMSGNVWQWCNDWYALYTSGDEIDPLGPATGTLRILRGGSWHSHDFAVYSAYRWEDNPAKRFSDVGFRCVMGLSVPPPRLISPADKDTGMAQSLTLSWIRVSGAALYHAQVSKDSLFGVIDSQDSTLDADSMSVSGLGAGATYYWRVRSINKGGTSAWSAAWSFSTALSSPPAVPSVPTLVSPDSGSMSHSAIVALVWSMASGAVTYHFQVSTSSSFAPIVSQDSTLIADSATVGGLADRATYYWRVRAKNAAGVSGWTTPWSFVMPTLLPIAPSVPTLVSPANGSTSQSLTPSLVWSTVATATSYRVQVSQDSAFFSVEKDDSSLTSTTKMFDSLTGFSTTYFWRVRAKNASGVSVWSSPWSFRTTAPPVPFVTLLSPVDGNTLSSNTPTLVWKITEGAAITRHVQVSTSPLMSPVFVQDSTLTADSMKLSGLVPNTRYYWWVRAKNAVGVTAWTVPWSFTTAALPATPALLSPVNAAFGQPTSLTFSWGAVSGAATYDVQVSTSSTFGTTITEDSTLTSASKAITNLAAGSTFYWRVRAKNAIGVGPWSGAWSLTTALPPAAPSVPTLLSPANAGANQTLTPTLAWSTVSTAATYHVQVSTSNTFTAILSQDSTLTSDSMKLSGLGALTTYYWRVRAKNAGGVSSWTSPWSFATGNLTPVIDIRVGANSVVVDGGRAYVTAGTLFEVYDVSNPLAPVKLGSVTHGYTDVRVEAHAIANNIVWCVRSSSGGYGAATYVFGVDVTNPASPVLRGSLTLQTASSLLSSSSTIYSGYLLVHDYSRNLIYVINISNPSAPTVFSQWSVPNMVDGGPGFMLIEGATLYLPCGETKTLKIYNLSNLAGVSLVGSVSFPQEEPYGPVVKIGSYLYLNASVYSGPTFIEAYTEVINVANPASPSVVGTLAPNGYFKMKNNKLFSLNDAKIYSYSLANPAAPVITDSSTVAKPAGTADLYLTGMAMSSATWVGDYLIGYTRSDVYASSGVRAVYFPVP